MKLLMLSLISVQISADWLSYRIHQNGEIASLMKAFFCRAIQVYKYLLCLYKYKKAPEFLVLGKQFLQGPVIVIQNKTY